MHARSTAVLCLRSRSTMYTNECRCVYGGAWGRAGSGSESAARTGANWSRLVCSISVSNYPIPLATFYQPLPVSVWSIVSYSIFTSSSVGSSTDIGLSLSPLSLCLSIYPPLSPQRLHNTISLRSSSFCRSSHLSIRLACSSTRAPFRNY